jgi:pimeloyl-ACP methyl ester carboxylesterase
MWVVMLTDSSRFTVHVPSNVLADLTTRLAATRWPVDFEGDDWAYGVNLAYLQDLASYWASEFDWRAAEARINQYDNRLVDVGGTPIHFLRVPGVGPAPIPLILSHGWPWTFWDWHKVLGPLSDPATHGGDPADAFDVIVPSLPGFAFSNPLARGDLNTWKIADLWDELMRDMLGYRRYAASGCDMGAAITEQLGHKYADHLYGVHLGHAVPLNVMTGERPWDLTGGRMVPEGVSEDVRRMTIERQRNFAAHIAVHVLEPQTLSYGLTDSPVGMLAWILNRLRNWSDCNGDIESTFSRDHILTNATIWWANAAMPTAIRSYANLSRYPWQPAHYRVPVIEAPAGITFLGYENPPAVTTEDRVAAFLANPLSKLFNTVYLKAYEHGGHFLPVENPQAAITDIRSTFRMLR